MDMKLFNEQYRDHIRLTQNQKAILATLAQADGSLIADDILASSPNLSGALKQLTKMRMVANEKDDQYIITDIGKEYATEANIIDGSGTITGEGTALVIGAGKAPDAPDTTDADIEEEIEDLDITAESVGNFKDYLILT